jgi:diacylglycerol O-acyltransferase
MSAEQLGALDGSFVLIERPGLPMHVGGLAVLDSAARPRGPIQLGELRRRLRSRLRELPRLRERLCPQTFGLQRPVWVADADFDIGQHLDHWTLAPGSGRRELLRLAGELHGRLLARDRPLWRVALIDGLPGDRQALLTTTHHAITTASPGSR